MSSTIPPTKRLCFEGRFLKILGKSRSQFSLLSTCTFLEGFNSFFRQFLGDLGDVEFLGFHVNSKSWEPISSSLQNEGIETINK